VDQVLAGVDSGRKKGEGKKSPLLYASPPAAFWLIQSITTIDRLNEVNHGFVDLLSPSHSLETTYSIPEVQKWHTHIQQNAGRTKRANSASGKIMHRMKSDP
jgi:hypothetical protein